MLRNSREISEVKYNSAHAKATKWKLEQGTCVKAFGELLGTAFLLFIGCLTDVGSMTVNPRPEHLTAFNMGLVVNSIIMMLGHISGAYINPAMTIGAVICGYRSVPTGIILIIGEIVGAVLGYGLLLVVTPLTLRNTGYSESGGVCLTLVYPELSSLQGLIVEIVSTIALMMVNCAAWDSRNTHNSDSTSLRIGFAVTALSVAGVPYTGCSMNPARSFAPALWNNNWTSHWVYWVGPVIGAVIGSLTYTIIFKDRPLKSDEDTRD
ncbi:aquaporin AQPAn.G-like isoform X1 [Neodiprion virginianus]|uniref:aquaporin AQPAn.G-like isoform X1 n=2 Tax=Neodiprion virginianus TaxID=2961670 RepID=UPI001EE6D7BF|nr:aquaporin AQPAn.G-like isoform X1 [Neodiprion virginianus]